VTSPPPPPPGTPFDELPSGDQERIRSLGNHLVQLAWQYAGGLIIGPPPSEDGEIHTASYCLLEKDGKTYLVTAEHVLTKTEKLQIEAPLVVWQANNLIFNPCERIASRDPQNDVALFQLRTGEAAEAGRLICTTGGWPPPRPAPGDFVLVSGYPAVIREHTIGRLIKFWALSALLEITTSGEFHLVSQWERENMTHFGGAGAPGIPPPGIELGGMSGGPVLFVRKLDYPLVGIVTDFHTGWELMRFAHLSAATIP
jgi:hypothetical protein